MDSWSAFSGDSSAGRQQRYATNVLQQGSSSGQHSRDLNPQQPPQLTTMTGPAGPTATTQQPYQAYHGTSTGNLSAVNSPTTRLENNTDYNMDVQMQDADPYNRAKYQQTQNSRQPYLGSEESSASQRYSPMNTSVSSQTPYTVAPPAGHTAQQASYSQMPAYQSRQSPSRPNYSGNSGSYYSQSSAASPRTSAPPSMQSYQHPLQQQQSASGPCAH